MYQNIPPYESNKPKGNPAVRAYIGTSAAVERGMVTWVMRLHMRVQRGFLRQEHLYIPRISGN